ncbi:DHA2 family efflux MFS transporter permease subunit [Xanthomonas arboricola]|nr:DHA2 family efflux MFS transporter permease subunit [Xanthomonas arboricola]PPT44467.1 MFS transporter [Xanthomonas arboricola]PPT52899.1 MFS transporter [Xanthomonas arboricola]PPU46013.1 MFS transporter [Xanthomonas arboricola]CAE6780289.1 putative transport protein HsrA [Xanthomonas arboricola]CAE6780304.1 putative transport protein HsrA [Xanthomonas arboricola]
MSSSVSEAGVTPPRYPDYRIISLILACAIFMEQMDATVLATALPTLARDFGVAAPAMSIAMTSYLLALAVLIPASGAIADRFGLRRVFGASIWVFVGGSILCSLADSLPTMVAARVLQGAGGAMMAPLGRLILLRTVERRHLVSAMAWTLVPAFIGPMLGPPLGGFFVSYLDWRWIFYINVPIGIAGFLLVRRFIPEIPTETTPARFDLRGFVLCGTALGCLLFGLEMVSQQDGIGTASWLLAIGGSAALGYLWHARHHPAPLLDLSLLRIDSFRLSVIGGALMRITQGAHPFLLPLLFQIGFGMSAAHSGRLILATALGALLMRSITPQLLRRFGYRNSLIGNGVLASLGYMVCALFRPDWPPALMFGLLLCCGAFMSFQFAAYNTIAYENVPASRMSRASSLYTTLQQLMLSVGVCAGAMILKLAMLAGDHTQPAQRDFSLAFCVVSLISLSATWWHVRFDKDAGQEMSGHRASSG